MHYLHAQVVIVVPIPRRLAILRMACMVLEITD